MKTLEEIKDEVAKGKGAHSWDYLISKYAFIEEVQKFNDEAARRFALEVAKEALKNAHDSCLKESVNGPESALNAILSHDNIPEL